MTLLDGAGQIRLLSRLGLHHTARQGTIERRIGDAVASLGILNARDQVEGAVNVMMVGSLAGATGSGSYIQLALLLQAICKERNVAAEVRGLFLLPDVFVQGAGLGRDQVQNVLANGYASLKELNAIINHVTDRGKPFPLGYEYAPGRRLLTGGVPFRSVAFVDFENVRSGNYGRSLETYKRMAARAAFLLLFTPIGQKVASAGVNDARARLAAAAQGTQNLYAGIGVSALVYPAREMADYLTLRLAAENLGGDWLRLDRAYFERVKRYQEQRRLGNLSVERPDQAQAFLEDLTNLATKDRLPFFAEVRASLPPQVPDESGAP